MQYQIAGKKNVTLYNFAVKILQTEKPHLLMDLFSSQNIIFYFQFYFCY